MAEARSTPVERAFPFWICQVQFSASTSGSSQLPLSPNETSLLSRLSAGTRHACGGHTHTHGQGPIHTPDTPKDIHRDTHTHTTEINLRKWQHIAIKHLWFCFFVCFLSEFSSINCVSLHKYRSSPSCSSLPNVEFSIFCQFPHGHQWRIKLLSPLASLLVTVTGRGHRALSFHVCAIPESNS